MQYLLKNLAPMCSMCFQCLENLWKIVYKQRNKCSIRHVFLTGLQNTYWPIEVKSGQTCIDSLWLHLSKVCCQSISKLYILGLETWRRGHATLCSACMWFSLIHDKIQDLVRHKSHGNAMKCLPTYRNNMAVLSMDWFACLSPPNGVRITLSLKLSCLNSEMKEPKLHFLSLFNLGKKLVEFQYAFLTTNVKSFWI